MNVFIRAMVRVFSFGERRNILFNEAIAEYIVKTAYFICLFVFKVKKCRFFRPKQVYTSPRHFESILTCSILTRPQIGCK